MGREPGPELLQTRTKWSAMATCPRRGFADLIGSNWVTAMNLCPFVVRAHGDLTRGSDPLAAPAPAGAARAVRYGAQISSRMLSLSKASLKVAVGSMGSCTPSQRTWEVSCPCAIEPSLAVRLTVVVKVALPFVSFWLSLPHSVKCPLQSTPASLNFRVPVSVKVAQNSSLFGKKVTCSTRLP